MEFGQIKILYLYILIKLLFLLCKDKTTKDSYITNKIIILCKTRIIPTNSVCYKKLTNKSNLIRAKFFFGQRLKKKCSYEHYVKLS